jgi:L-alanine-DL-glutamate epimerase-like enolase superfamily enzyme
MERLTREAGIPVAADESCPTPAAAQRIIERQAAHVINIKTAKSGVIGALDIIAVARSAGLKLMIGGMLESRIAMGFSAHLAAGLGHFDWIDLDTPLLLARDPISSGCHLEGPRYMLPEDQSGHGGELLPT